MKTNPKKKPATQADVKKAFEAGVKEGVSNSCAIFLTVLLDKFRMDDQIQEVWNEICDLSDSVGKGYVSLADLRHVLMDEYGIQV